MRTRTLAVLVLAVLPFVWSGRASSRPSTTTAARRRPIPGFDVKALDRKAVPCDDFYQYACGTWLKHNPVPLDQSAWGRFDELQERNREILRQILEQYARPRASRSTDEQKIGDYYAACMDERAIDARGVAPLGPALERIAAMSSKAALPGEVARLHELGVSALFDFGSGQDFKDASRVIAQADQGGLGLPDRDYYLRTDPKSVELRDKYVAHVQKMLELLGEPAPQAAAGAQAVLRIETALAKSSLDRVARRNPTNVYHKMSTAQLQALDPSFAWPRYLEGVQAPPFHSLNVAVPRFFRDLGGITARTSLDDWKAYLRWHLVNDMAALLARPFVDEDFAFYGKTLRGAREIRPRWKRCVSLVDGDLGFALGKKYVERTFGAEGKRRTLAMVEALERALGEDITQAVWMSPETKKKAREKLHAITNNIGYPDRWRDYSAVEILRGDALGNHERAARFEVRRQLRKIDQPVDRAEWSMTPSTVNAYYDPQLNSINFPAGILQPPFFDKRMDDAVNFGAIGAVIGHELTHGFDDEGRRFGPKGNLREWWTPQDAKRFDERAACFVKEYSAFIAIDDVKLNGKLTLGENIADNGGLRIAHLALDAVRAGAPPRPIKGFTAAQRFFLAWGQIWCRNVTPQAARMRALVDPHSPSQYRVNGVVSNMATFREAFTCRGGQPMVREPACRVW